MNKYKKSSFTESEIENIESIFKSIRLINHSIRDNIETRMAPLGLTAAQLHPIALISKNIATTPASIAQYMDTDTGALTRTLDRLEKKEFLTRNRCQNDRRVVNLELTDKGHEVANQLMPTVFDVFKEHLEDFNQDELQSLQKLLKKLNSRQKAAK